MIETIFYTIFETYDQYKYVSPTEDFQKVTVWKVDGMLVSQSYYMRRRAEAMFDAEVAGAQPDDATLAMSLLLQRWRQTNEEREGKSLS